MTDILGWEWIDFDELGSTNDKARELTAEPPAKRFVVTAETQNKGRGRRFPGPADFRQGKQFQLGFGVFTHKFLLFLFIKYVSGINFRQMAGFLQQQQAVVVNTPENAAFYFFFRRHRNFGSEPPGVLQP